MSQEQYNTLLSNLLREKCALAKLRVELKGQKGKLCRCCKGFGHLAQNCRNKNEEGKGAITPQNKFEVLSSRVMQCGEEEKAIRSVKAEGVKCFKCGKEGHKCRECPLWVKKEKAVRVASPRKAQQGRGPACPVREKAQEEKRKLRRVEEGGAACPTKGKVQQEKMEKEFVGDVEEEGGVVLWTNSAMRCGVVGAGVVQPRSCRHIFEMPKMWQRGMLCGR